MTAQNFLTDPILCLLGLLLLAPWAWLQYQATRPKLRGEETPGKTLYETFLRLLCGLLLVYASRDKIGNAAEFSQMIHNYQLLTPFLTPLAALVIPWVEFFSGLSLIFGFRSRGGALLFCALMGLYALAIAFDLSRGVDINCGCGLTDPAELATWWSVLRDLLFLGAGLAVLFSRRTLLSLDLWLKK